MRALSNDALHRRLTCKELDSLFACLPQGATGEVVEADIEIREEPAAAPTSSPSAPLRRARVDITFRVTRGGQPGDAAFPSTAAPSPAAPI